MHSKEYWIQWIKFAGIRAVKTFAQSALATIPVAVTINEVEWMHVLGVAALAAVISLFTSLAGIPEVDDVE